MPFAVRWLTALLLAPVALLAQSQEPPKTRPKIGLALSGGSALGLAHVGVLQYLAEHHIPIDYIAGTSMGSLVGGLYATGRTPDEIAKFVSEIDWNRALSPSTPFQDLSYRRKQDQRDYPAALEFGLKRGLKLPSGLSAGHGVGLIISRITAPYDEIDNFDALPTPFRCVATDLHKGAEVVFSNGALFDALRASMSLPALFAPVVKDDMYLVDGGLLNNIPVDVVRSMGADIVIAVALDKPPSESQYRSMLGVAGRSISLLITANEHRSLGQADLVIMPALDGIESMDYLKWEQLIDRGFEAARLKSKLLTPLSVSPEDYSAYTAARAARRRSDQVRPEVLELEGEIEPRRRDALMKSIAANPALPVDRDALESELTRITGLGRFDSANYWFIRRGNAEGLRIRVHEKDYGPPFLRVGVLLDASRQEGFRFGIGARLTLLDFGATGAELRSDLSIGQINRLTSEYYYRPRKGRWFLAPRLFLLEDSLPFYRGDTQISDFTTRQAGGALDYGLNLGRFSELRLGYALSHNRFAISKGLTAFDPLTGRYNDFHLQWAFEGQDSALVPRHGLRATLRGAWVLDHPGVNSQFATGEASLSYARPLNKLYSLIHQFSGGWAPNEDALASQFVLGGVGRMDALGRGRLLGNRYYYGGTHLLRSLSNDSLALLGKFYLFTAAEVGQAWWSQSFYRPRYSGSLGLMGETSVGVVYFGAGFGDQGDRRLFFRLGRVF